MKCIIKNCIRETADDSTNYCFEHKFGSGTITKVIPGSLTLASLRNALALEEVNASVELIGLAMLSDHNNLASFKRISSGQVLSQLALVEVKVGQNIQSIIAEQLSKGKSLMFSSSIFIQDQITEVVAFR